MVRRKTLARSKSRVKRARQPKNEFDNLFDRVDGWLEDINEIMEHGEHLAKSIERFAPKQEQTKLQRTVMLSETIQMKDLDAANLLGVSIDAKIEDIMSAFRKKLETCRPDKYPEKKEEYLRLYSAYSILMSKRKQKVFKGRPKIESDPW